MQRRLFILLLIGSFLPSASPLPGQKRVKPAAFTDPAAAGEDFEIQGEYSGLVSGAFRARRWGVQVVALGEGIYRAVWLSGGLPGDGWDRTTRVEIEGRRHGPLAVFQRFGHYSPLIVNGELWLRETDGTVMGVLRKVHRRSPTLGRRPPAGAIVLFDGSSTEHFTSARMTDDGLLMEGPITKLAVGDFTLHMEFRTPFMPAARGQQRGNSGAYLQRRYEVQILDSFGLEGKHNECGGLYRQRPPDVNLCLPPLSWQTYDIEFRAARFDGQGKKTENARITLRHNGVVIHDDYPLKNKTGAGRPEGPQPLPILLQNHGNPVRFRNIWLHTTARQS